MSTKNAKIEAEEGVNENFSWDTQADDMDFFGTSGKAATAVKPKSVDEVIKQVVTEDDDFEVEDEETTKVDEKKKPAKVKAKAAKAETEEDEIELNSEEEDNPEESDFTFGQPKAEPKKKTEVPAKKEGKEKVKPEADDEEDEEENEEDQKAGKEDDETEPESDQKFFGTLAKEMKEKGIFEHAKFPEGKEELGELEEEEFFEMQNQEVEGRVQETFEAFFEELDEEGAAFLKFKKDGGRSQDFINVFGSSPVPDFEGGYNPEDESHRQEVIESYLYLVDKMDDEEVKDRLEWLKENGKEKAFADKYYNKLVEIDTAQKTALLKGQEAAAKKREADTKKFNQALFELLDKTEQVGQIKITKEDKKRLGNIITKPSVKVGKNKYVPEFNYKLGQILKAETPEAKQTLLLLAKLVDNGFDFTDIAVKAETKVAQKVKSKLRDSKNGVKPSSSGNYSKKSLSDFFNE
jgi:hypothetical protein